MARSLSVKIPTASLIADIEASLAQIEKDIAEYPAKAKAFREALEAYNEKIVAITIEALGDKNLIGTAFDSPIRIDTRYGRVSIEVTDPKALGFPEYPEKPIEPNQRESFGREWTTRKQLLEKNLKVLKMTTQEEVNASTYNTVMELL
jgi:hypothetical protein